MVCPLGERRGTVVFCKAINKKVNPMVMPCLGRAYEKCKYYREALTRRIEREEKEEALLPTQWSREESEKLADPINRLDIVARAPVVLVRITSVSSIEDVVKTVSSAPEWVEKCFVVSLRSGEKTAYVKFCKGVLIATAIEDEAVEPSDVDEFLESSSKLGLKVRITLYRSE